jgi:hypothetical protein
MHVAFCITNFLSESELHHDWQFTANQFVLATIPLTLTTSNFFQLNPCGYSPYATSSLTRRWVCRLQLLLVFASIVILGSESRETHDHILLSQTRDSSNLEGQVPVFISPKNRFAQLHPQALSSFFFASYDSQAYSGGIRPHLHTGYEFLVNSFKNLKVQFVPHRKHTASVLKRNLLIIFRDTVADFSII